MSISLFYNLFSFFSLSLPFSRMNCWENLLLFSSINYSGNCRNVCFLSLFFFQEWFVGEIYSGNCRNVCSSLSSFFFKNDLLREIYSGNCRNVCSSLSSFFYELLLIENIILLLCSFLHEWLLIENI